MDTFAASVCLLSLLVLSVGCETSQPTHPEGTSTSSAGRDAPPTTSADEHVAAPPSSASATHTEPVTIPDDRVFVRVTRMNGGHRVPAPGTLAPPFRRVVVAIRGDGKAVWSEDAKGEGPLRTGTVDRARLDQWVAGVRAAGTLVDPAMKSHVGPDATSIELDIDFGDQRLKITSWHEMLDPTKAIALSKGVVALDGRKPEELLAKEPPEYRRFLEAWTELRKDIRGLLPKSGEALPEGANAEDVLTAKP